MVEMVKWCILGNESNCVTRLIHLIKKIKKDLAKGIVGTRSSQTWL